MNEQQQAAVNTAACSLYTIAVTMTLSTDLDYGKAPASSEEGDRVKAMLQQKIEDWDEKDRWTPLIANICQEFLRMRLPKQVTCEIIEALMKSSVYSLDTLDDLLEEVTTIENAQKLLGTENRVAAKNLLGLSKRNRAEPPIPVEVHFKARKDLVQWKRDELTMEALTKRTREAFNIPAARLVFTIEENVVIEQQEQLDQLKAGCGDKPVQLKVVLNQVGFSSIKTIGAALRLLGQHGESDAITIDDTAFPKALEMDDKNEELVHAMTTIEKVSGVLDLLFGCEMTRRVYIDPLLIASARVAGNIKLEVERNYQNQDLNGPVDYTFKFGEQTICVTEGKKDNLEAGVVQNLAQLVAVRDERKRKFDEISSEQTPIYGIATTYTSWSFLKLSDDQVVRSSPISIHHSTGQSNIEDIKMIIGRIVAILQEGKANKED